LRGFSAALRWLAVCGRLLAVSFIGWKGREGKWREDRQGREGREDGAAVGNTGVIVHVSAAGRAVLLPRCSLHSTFNMAHVPGTALICAILKLET
jgi:hypothetical protein